MKLTDLEAKFLRAIDSRSWQQGVSMSEATGVWFLCPTCFKANGGRIGTHGVICWSKERGTPDDLSPKPGRWRLVGTGLEDLTLDGENGRSRSVLLTGGCGWHGFVTNGEVTDA